MESNVKDLLEVTYWAVSTSILIATVYYIYRSPIKAIEIGRKLDNEAKKRELKFELFLTLFAYRGSPLEEEFVHALNQIDIVFQEDKNVLIAWKKLYDILHQKELVGNLEIWNVHRIELLSEMAICLGYNSLHQTDIMKYYLPEGHLIQENDDLNYQQVSLQYYQKGQEFYSMMIESMKKKNQ